MRHLREDKPHPAPVVLADSLPDAHAVHVTGEIAPDLRLAVRRGVTHMPRAERTHVPPPLVLNVVKRLGERPPFILIIVQGLEDAVFDILLVESMRVFRANVVLRPSAGEGDCFLVHALCLSLKVPGPFRRLRKTLASTLPLPPDLCQKCEEIFQWIEARKRIGLKHGGASD